ncbi:MAG: xanthine dehydrogenase family protein subunit M [Acidobacteriota bacterium]
MYPEKFDYFCPDTLEGVIELLTQYGDDAKIMAGGQSLIPLMKLRLASPKYVIDLDKLQNLSGISEQGGEIVIGAMTRYVELAESELVKSKLRLLHDAVNVVADVQVRNLGTVAGSLAHADPGGDLAPALLALNAQVDSVSSSGNRTQSVSDLLVDAYLSSLKGDEVITGIRVPIPPEGSGGTYLKFERRAGDFAVASVGVQLTLDKNGGCAEIAISMGAVGVTALRAAKAEGLLRGQAVSDDLLKEAASAASAETDPFSDIRGSEEYKRHLVGVLLRRAFDIASRRAGGEEVSTAHV